MASQFSKDSFRGILVPDERINEASIDAGESSYSQAGPRPGVPVPQGDTDLSLEASGTQSAGKQLRIATQRGGHPGLGGATYRWKEEADPATSWRGAWPSNAISGWETARPVDPGTATGRRAANDPHAVLMDNNKIGIVYAEEHFALGTSNYRISFYTIDETGTIASDVVIYSSLSDNEGLHPCIVKLPSGRLMIYHYLEGSNDTCQVQSWTSTDHGLSWTISNSAALDESIDTSAGATGFDLDTRPSAKMRAAYAGGQVLLLISARSNDGATGSYQDALIQYASSNQGLSFEHIETFDRTITGTQGEVVASANGFEVFYVGGSAGSDAVIRKSLASCFIPISSATQQNGPGVLQAGDWAPGGIAARLNTDAEIAVTVGDDGILYIVARGRHTAGTYASSNLSDIRICMDLSGGASRNTFYKLMGQGESGTASGAAKAGTVYFGEASSDYPRFFGFAPAWGKLHLFHNNAAGVGTRRDAIGWMQLGGYSSITLGAYNDDGSLERRVCWDRTWIPFETPDNSAGWTLGTTGGSHSINDGYLEIITAGARRQFIKPTTGTIAEGVISHFGVEFVSSTGAPGADLIVARFKQADGSNDFTLDVIIRDGEIECEDNNGGGNLGTLAIDTKTDGVEILVFSRSGECSVFARLRDNASGKLWSTVCSNATLTDGGSGTSEIRFGHTILATATSRWYWFNWTSDEYAGGTPASAGFTNPDDLLGQPFNNLGSSYVSDGTRIRGVDGPTIPGDLWNIDTKYDYPIANIIPATEPSPAKGWRSTDETQQTIAFGFAGANRYSSLGLQLSGINWRTGSLDGWNGAAWVTLASIDAATGQTSLAYVEGGTSYTVDTGATTAAGRYLELDEFVGGTAFIDPAGAGARFSRSITRSGPGVWTNAAGALLPSLEVSEPAPLFMATTGTLDIWSPRLLVAVHNVGGVYSKFRLVIDANQNAVGGFYKIGQMVAGPLFLFSQDYSWGRSFSTTPGSELVTYRDGSRSSSNLSANRRSVSFGWGEGVDVSALHAAAAAPDYLKGTTTAGAPVIGYRGDITSIVHQINTYTKGSHIPVVYCPRIEAGSTGDDVKTIQGLQGAIYGRIIGGVTIDNVVGEELTDDSGEVLMVANVMIEEEL